MDVSAWPGRGAARTWQRRCTVARIAHQLARPRIQSLRRTSSLVVVFSFIGIAVPAFLFVALVPGADQALWADTPLAGVAQHLLGPAWATGPMTFALVCAAFLVLAPAANAAVLDAEQQLRKLAEHHTLPEGLMRPHRRFGTMASAIDVTAAAVIFIVFASAGQVPWLSRAYAFTIAVRLCLKVASLLKIRRVHPPPPYRAASIALWIAGAVGMLSAGALIAGRDVPSLASAALMGSLAIAFNFAGHKDPTEAVAPLDTFELLPSPELAVGQVEARPGNVLVAVRNPHSLCARGCRASGRRRSRRRRHDGAVLGIDVEDDGVALAEPTPPSASCCRDVVALAERYRPPGAAC